MKNVIFIEKCMGNVKITIILITGAFKNSSKKWNYYLSRTSALSNIDVFAFEGCETIS